MYLHHMVYFIKSDWYLENLFSKLSRTSLKKLKIFNFYLEVLERNIFQGIAQYFVEHMCILENFLVLENFKVVKFQLMSLINMAKDTRSLKTKCINMVKL